MEIVSPIYEVSIKIPFPSKRSAEIAYDVLRIDEEPKRSSITKALDLEDNILLINLSGDQAKNVRVALTSFFEAIILCCETMEQFGPPTTEKYDFY